MYDYITSSHIIGGTASEVYPNRDCVLFYHWHHVALCRDGSNNMRLFLNGNLLAKVSNTSNYDNDQITFGRRPDGTPSSPLWYEGYISNARFIKGESIYSEDFTPPTTELEG